MGKPSAPSPRNLALWKFVLTVFCRFMVFRRQRVAKHWKILENSSWSCTFCCNVICLRIIYKLPNSEAEGRSLLPFERPIWYGNMYRGAACFLGSAMPQPIGGSYIVPNFGTPTYAQTVWPRSTNFGTVNAHYLGACLRESATSRFTGAWPPWSPNLWDQPTPIWFDLRATEFGAIRYV